MSSNTRWGKLEDRYDWKELQAKHDAGQSISNIKKESGMSYYSMRKGIELNFLQEHKAKRPPMSQETKLKMGDSRKKWLNENPDKHPWRNKDKFKSTPCEKIKEFLTSKNIQFVPEFQPTIDGRFFSIDIAMPDKMIAIEVNGNQHYERDGSLTSYYQERHNLLESHGWNVYEVHYSACFNLEKWEEFFDKIYSSDILVEFDYFTYVRRETKQQRKTCECGKSIWYSSLRCRDCNNKHNFKCRRNFKAPPKEELEKLIWELPFTKIGIIYGVSDNTIRKWCKKEEIVNFPPRGFFISKVGIE